MTQFKFELFTAQIRQIWWGNFWGLVEVCRRCLHICYLLLHKTITAIQKSGHSRKLGQNFGSVPHKFSQESCNFDTFQLYMHTRNEPSAKKKICEKQFSYYSKTSIKECTWTIELSTLIVIRFSTLSFFDYLSVTMNIWE